MPTRRQFLQSSATLAAGLAASRFVARADAPRPLGVQLYTVRDLLKTDLAGVLKQLRAIGYSEVETYWDVYNVPAPQLRQIILDSGLTVPSGHFNYDKIDSKMIVYARELGLEYMICPMLRENQWNDVDDFKRAAELFNKWGERAKQVGIQFGFHNHNYEFRKFGDTTGFDVLTKVADPNLVCLEMDCYWIAQAGEDPLAMFKKYGSRIKLLHLKDRLPGFPPTQVKDAAAEHFTEVGAGTIDWKSIIDTARQNGVKHFFVERDSGSLPAIESLRVSFQNLKPYFSA